MSALPKYSLFFSLLVATLHCFPESGASVIHSDELTTTDSSIIFEDETASTHDSVEAATTSHSFVGYTSGVSPLIRETGATFGDCACGKKLPLIPTEDVVKSRSSVASKGIDPFIIPGIPAEAFEFPWIVGIQKKKWDGKFHVVCAGTVVNSRYIVTAAHCINTQSPSRLRLAFNSHNLSSDSTEKFEIRKIKRLIVHPGWNQETVDNDIGLIELEEPLDFTTSDVRPICLPYNTSHSAFDGKNATVAGWGYVAPGGPNSRVLNKATVPIISEKSCRDDTIYMDKILDSMICAGYDKGGVDACTNDSGGPLFIQDEDGTSKLVGIVSWGHGCAKPKSPGVYTRVTRFVDWIVTYTIKGQWCA